MLKRQKWTPEEDSTLRTVLHTFRNKNLTSDDWELVSKQMRDKTYDKSAKQCRER